MRFALIRHGQTDLNVQKRLQGASDWPLNERGLEQAHEAVQSLVDTGVGWDVVVSSPKQRARKTAEIIAEGLGIELGPSYPLLVERDYGAVEGDTEEQVERLWPGKTEPTVETLVSVVERGRRALDELAEEWAGKNLVVVCHGTIIRYTLSDIVGVKLPAPDNATVSEAEFIDGAWRVLTLSGEPVPAV